MALSKRIICGVVAGSAASAILSPIVQVFDVAVVKAASGQANLLKALIEGVLEWLKSPSAQLRNQAFQLVWRVYALTYASANTIKAVCEKTGTNPLLPNLILVTGVNLIASLLKDAAIAKEQKRKERQERREMQRQVSPEEAKVPIRKSLSRTISDALQPHAEKDKTFPNISFALFVVRDILTIGAGFVLPVPVSKQLQKMGLSAGASTTAAQLLCPAGVQTVTLPFHFLALDVFNFPGSLLIERLQRLASQYVKLTSVRMLRGFASFGIGGVGNSTILAILEK